MDIYSANCLDTDTCMPTWFDKKIVKPNIIWISKQNDNTDALKQMIIKPFNMSWLYSKYVESR